MQLSPSKVIRIPASRKFLHLESGIRDPGIWNVTDNWNPESGIQVSLKKIWNLVNGILKPQRGIQTPRLSWIPLHKAMKRRENQHGTETQRATGFPWHVFILTEITNVVGEIHEKKSLVK